MSTTLTAPVARSADVRSLTDVGLADLLEVGGKNASLGELLRNLRDAGVRVPDGFATTASAFRRYFRESGLAAFTSAQLAELDVDDVTALAATGARIRSRIEEHPLDAALVDAIRAAHAPFGEETSLAVRSSATAEDLPDASFAGQQETFLNIRGIDQVLDAVRRVFASLFTDRAIAYRLHQGFDHDEVAISVGVQRMVRSDLSASGVLFTLDTESGFDGAVFITSAYGLGEGVVQGAVDPDEFTVHKRTLREGRPAVLSRRVGGKALRMVFTEDRAVGRTTAFEETGAQERRRFSITDSEATELARAALAIEEHYGAPMDVEWGRDGLDGRLYILQARPETVVSRRPAGIVERHRLDGDGPVLVEGRAIGQRIGAGRVRVLSSPSEMASFRAGEVLVADMTDPDWEPIMQRAAAIVTNRGGRTCHAAIIARELGVPAIVGTGDATERLVDGRQVTVSCAEGETGLVRDGIVPFHSETIEIGELPEAPVGLMLNVGNPEAAFALAGLPSDGVGLARMEFVIARQIGVHPLALLELDRQEPAVREEIEQRIAAYDGPEDFFVRRLAEGVATIAAAFDGRPVVVRLSDFKSNEYAGLLGGARYEPQEENPMIGFRGASRYRSEHFVGAFALECEAIRRVRVDMGLSNVKVMVPFVRTVAEAEQIVALLAANGLRRGEHGLEVIMMCEVPSNALLADAFLEYVDGFSIGSNDLTQLTLGVDRDSGLLGDVFDERDPAVLALIELAVAACRRRGLPVGVCGQAPSDHPELAERLIAAGVTSLSLNPDSIVETRLRLDAATGGASV